MKLYYFLIISKRPRIINDFSCDNKLKQKGFIND